MLCKTAEPWKASHFRCWICFPQGKLGKHHCTMDSNHTAKVSTWMAKGIINLIKAPFIPEASGGKAGEASRYKRSLAGQRLLPLVGRIQIKTLCGRTGKKKHPWNRFCLLVFAGSPRCNVKPVIYTSGTVLANL